MKKRIWFAVICILFSCLTSCEKGIVDPSEAVLVMAEASGQKVSGRVYTTESSCGAPDYLSPEFLSELLGHIPELSGTRGALYLSDGISLFEVAFFDCPSPYVADALGGLFALRFKSASETGKRTGLGERDFAVKIYGNYVLAAMCEDCHRSLCAGVEKIEGFKLRFVTEKG